MKIKQINKINLATPISLVDIGVEGDHTFFVSNKPTGNFFLTHNSYPDIDSDFSDRDKAVKLLVEFFGEENVIPVTNFAQLQLRSLIKDIARLYGLPFAEINSATGKIEAEVLAKVKQKPGFDRGVWVLTFEDAIEHSETFQSLLEKHPEFEQTIKVLFKQT